MQREDISLQKLWKLSDAVIGGQQKVSFKIKSNVLHRLFTHPKINYGESLHQVVVPTSLHLRVMEIAHNSMIGGP